MTVFRTKINPIFLCTNYVGFNVLLAVLIGSLFLPSIAMDTCSITGRNERME
jgi:hypothetical protein